MQHSNLISSLTARLNWYRKSIDMVTGAIPRENGFAFPTSTHPPASDPSCVYEWRGAARELQNTLDAMLDHVGKITIGASYPSSDGKDMRTVLAIHDDTLLLEMRSAESGELTQYCVARHPSFHEGILIWQQGEYYVAHKAYGCDPFRALCDAVARMRGPQTICLLICDTTEGAFASVHHSVADAKAALDKSLRDNLGLQRIAEELGLPCTAEAYLENKTDFDEHGAEDFYWIDEAVL